VKELKLPVSEILQGALRYEVTRQEKIAGLKSYLAELEAQLGPPSPEAVEHAKRLVARMLGEIPEDESTSERAEEAELDAAS
jgi:hypothetical protein